MSQRRRTLQCRAVRGGEPIDKARKRRPPNERLTSRRDKIWNACCGR